MGKVSMVKSFMTGAKNINTWFIFMQYACCFGVEITMNNAAAMYFKETFEMTTASAAAVASIFGWMNLFARGTGGFLSDKFNARMGMKGRLLWQSICLAIEGGMVLIFAHVQVLWLAILVMIIFSVFVQMAEGSSYGIVPYIDPPVTGSISGIIGAGGNVGAVAFGFCFRQMSPKMAFITMGAVILSTSLLSIFVRIPEPLTSSAVISEEKSLQITDTPLTPTTDADTSFTHSDALTADEIVADCNNQEP
jgi:NNP family nitrate/nitrite transporter-like MFS transporter